MALINATQRNKRWKNLLTDRNMSVIYSLCKCMTCVKYFLSLFLPFSPTFTIMLFFILSSTCGYRLIGFVVGSHARRIRLFQMHDVLIIDASLFVNILQIIKLFNYAII